jgi:hypothetical protein
MESAKVLLARDQDLLNKNVLDHQTYDTQRYLVAQLQATVQADQANGPVVQAVVSIDYGSAEELIVTPAVAARQGMALSSHNAKGAKGKGGGRGGKGKKGAGECFPYNNHWEKCTRKNCPFPHTCSRCGGKHPAYQCQNQGGPETQGSPASTTL